MNIQVTQQANENDSISFLEGTDKKVASILNSTRKSGVRIRIFYGDPDTGLCELREFDVIGRVLRTIDGTKRPILSKRADSRSGVIIDTLRILRITRDKDILYSHKKFHVGDFKIESVPLLLSRKGFASNIFRNGEHVGVFTSNEKAEKWVSFMKGESNRF